MDSIRVHETLTGTETPKSSTGKLLLAAGPCARSTEGGIKASKSGGICMNCTRFSLACSQLRELIAAGEPRSGRHCDFSSAVPTHVQCMFGPFVSAALCHVTSSLNASSLTC